MRVRVSAGVRVLALAGVMGRAYASVLVERARERGKREIEGEREKGGE